MSALILGSYAYDNIMVFPDRFRNHILPEKIHILNVSFLVPEMRREFGGCAGNIAYNLKLLGGDPLPMATVGTDFAPYGAWMDECGVPRRYVTEVPGTLTAQAFITTDLDDNQITAFHPGAMSESHRNRVDEADGVSIAIVSPDGREGMIQHAEQLRRAGIPFIFDPGQGLPMFGAGDLQLFLSQARWLTVNDYEWQLLQDRTGLSAADLAGSLEALIVTRGAQGSVIHTRDRDYEIPPVAPEAVKDPTGCGDAYRAGLLYGLMNGLDWDTTGRIASLMGAIKVAVPGTQNHRFDRDEFSQRFRAAFGCDLMWA